MIDKEKQIFSFTKNLIFRLVDINDAAFILSLRTDTTLNQHVSTVENDLNKQVDWLHHYKLREQKGQELYYKIGNNDEAGAHGLVRIYDISASEQSCKAGSWILKPEAPKTAAVETMLSIYQFVFTVLNLKTIHLDVRKDNTSVINIHTKFGAQFLKEDDMDMYFTLTLADFELARKRYARLLLPEVRASLAL